MNSFVLVSEVRVCVVGTLYIYAEVSNLNLAHTFVDVPGDVQFWYVFQIGLRLSTKDMELIKNALVECAWRDCITEQSELMWPWSLAVPI
jgi:hypothetical protein